MARTAHLNQKLFWDTSSVNLILRTVKTEAAVFIITKTANLQRKKFSEGKSSNL